MPRFATAFLAFSLTATLAPFASAAPVQNAPPPPPPPDRPSASGSGISRAPKLPSAAAMVARCRTLLRSSDRKTRLRAVAGLAQVRRDNVPASLALVETLRDKDGEVRSRSLAALRERGPGFLPPLTAHLAILNDPKAAPESQVFALEQLVGVLQTGGPPAAAAKPTIRAVLPQLRALMQSPSALVRSAALQNYVGPRDTVYLSAIRPLLRDPDSGLRFEAAVQICGLNPSEAESSGALALVLEPLRSASPQKRSDTLITLANLLTALGSVPGSPHMSDIPFPLPGTSAESIDALYQKIETALLPLTHDTNPTVRAYALLALSVLRTTDASPAVIKALSEHLTDSDGGTRLNAARFFIEHTGDFAPAPPALLRLVQTPPPPVRDDDPPARELSEAQDYAYIALGKLGGKDKMVRDTLLTLLPRYSADSDPPDRRAFRALAEASVENPDLVGKLLLYRQQIVAQQTSAIETLPLDTVSSPEADRAEMIARVQRRTKPLSPEAQKKSDLDFAQRRQAERRTVLAVVQARKRDELQTWQGERFADLLDAQKDNAEPFANLTAQFDREPPKVRQAALFALVHQTNWTGPWQPPKTTLVLDWMKNTLATDKDPLIREYAAHGTATTQGK